MSDAQHFLWERCHCYGERVETGVLQHDATHCSESAAANLLAHAQWHHVYKRPTTMLASSLTATCHLNATMKILLVSTVIAVTRLCCKFAFQNHRKKGGRCYGVINFMERLKLIYARRTVSSLDVVHEMNAYSTFVICLSVCRVIKLGNRWTDLDEIWYERYADGDCSKYLL
jgi:hypothetical protein